MPDRMPTQVEVAISNALLACGTLGFSGGKNRLDAAAELVAALAADGVEIQKIAKGPIDPVFFPPLDPDERRLWIDTYVACVRMAELIRQPFHVMANEAIRQYRHAVKR